MVMKMILSPRESGKSRDISFLNYAFDLERNGNALQENMTFATVKIALCDGPNHCNVTFATVLQPSMISMSQLHFATVLKTVVTSVAIVSATVINRPYMIFSAHCHYILLVTVSVRLLGYHLEGGLNKWLR
jgi:hypothetical protein